MESPCLRALFAWAAARIYLGALASDHEVSRAICSLGPPASWTAWELVHVPWAPQIRGALQPVHGMVLQQWALWTTAEIYPGLMEYAFAGSKESPLI